MKARMLFHTDHLFPPVAHKLPRLGKIKLLPSTKKADKQTVKCDGEEILRADRVCLISDFTERYFIWISCEYR